jgi:hypothetical protein
MSPHATIRDGGTIHHHLCAYGWLPHPPDHCDVLNSPVRIRAAGYVRPERRFIVCNSWGIYPGMCGTFSIPFDYLAGRTLGDDCRTIRCGENL